MRKAIIWRGRNTLRREEKWGRRRVGKERTTDRDRERPREDKNKERGIEEVINRGTGAEEEMRPKRERKMSSVTPRSLHSASHCSTYHSRHTVYVTVMLTDGRNGKLISLMQKQNI